MPVVPRFHNPVAPVVPGDDPNVVSPYNHDTNGRLRGLTDPSPRPGKIEPDVVDPELKAKPAAAPGNASARLRAAGFWALVAMAIACAVVMWARDIMDVVDALK